MARMTESPAIQNLLNARSKYVAEWEISSRHFFNSGYYDWMASKVLKQEKILEIGCGTGYATLKLAQQGHFIVAIDENPECLKSTKNRLEEHGFTVDLQLRSKTEEAAQQTYEVQYGKILEGELATVILIEGDMLNDPELKEWLTEEPRFDAIVCWLLGTHQYRAMEYRFGEYGSFSLHGFRILIQNAVYELADHALKPNGILHIVDRGGFVNDDRLIEGVMESHREQASVTSLVVKYFDHLAYAEAHSRGAISMTLTPPNKPIDGIDLADQSLSLISVISEKPLSA